MRAALLGLARSIVHFPTCNKASHPASHLLDCARSAIACSQVKAPRVGESAVQMECKLRQVIELNDK